MKNKQALVIADKVAVIEETDCIGCTKCIRVCPVDAILGAAKQMHTIIRDECIGCELCIASCPVNCIIMSPTIKFDEAQRQHKILQAYNRFDFRELRLQQDSLKNTKQQETIQTRKAAIQAAFLRVQGKKQIEQTKKT